MLRLLCTDNFSLYIPMPLTYSDKAASTKNIYVLLLTLLLFFSDTSSSSCIASLSIFAILLYSIAHFSVMQNTIFCSQPSPQPFVAESYPPDHPFRWFSVSGYYFLLFATRFLSSPVAPGPFLIEMGRCNSAFASDACLGDSCFTSCSADE